MLMKKRSVLWALAVFLFFSLALNQLARGQRSAGRAQLEEALHRTAVACYAIEGNYPPSVDYMVQHYGLQYDLDTYLVHYELFASNLMPDMMVVEQKP